MVYNLWNIVFVFWDSSKSKTNIKMKMIINLHWASFIASSKVRIKDLQMEKLM